MHKKKKYITYYVLCSLNYAVLRQKILVEKIKDQTMYEIHNSIICEGLLSPLRSQHDCCQYASQKPWVPMPSPAVDVGLTAFSAPLRLFPAPALATTAIASPMSK